MRSIAPQTIRFISAVRRRVIVIRLAESVAISIAIASLAALVLLPILWWRGQSALPLSNAAIGLGLVVGIIWGVARRPTGFAVAGLIDRQLKLDDLLGTVVRLPAAELTTPEWTQSIVAIAEQRCRNFTPGHLVLRRLDSRVWGGAGLLAALVLTLGFLTSQPGESRAGIASPLNSRGDEVAKSTEQPAVARAAAEALRSRPAGAGNVDENSNRNFSQENSQPDNSGAAGHGMSVTNANQSGDHNAPNVGSSGHEELTQGNLTGGVGAGDSQARGTGSPSGTVAASASDRTIAPWKSATWAGDVRGAEDAIRAGRVPDEEADLVRDYFRVE